MSVSIRTDEVRWREYNLPMEAYQTSAFVRFILDNNLHQMMAYCTHHTSGALKDQHQIVMQRGSPSLLMEGTRRSWEEIQNRVGIKEGFLKVPGWFYSYNRGLVPYDDVLWNEPLPIRQENPMGSYGLNICSAVKNSSFNGVHCYVELTCPDGLVYNFGLWSTEEFDRAGTADSCATVLGQVKCPDGFEFMGRKVQIVKTPVPLSKEQAKHIFSHVKSLQTAGQAFNWTRSNCAAFVADIAKLANVEIPLERSLATAFLPDSLNIWLDRMNASIPRSVKILAEIILKIVLLVPIILSNLICLCFFGASRGVLINGKKIAHIAHIGDLFEPRFFRYNPPGSVLLWQKQQKGTIITAEKARS